jgi:hypothetical protein
VQQRINEKTDSPDPWLILVFEELTTIMFFTNEKKYFSKASDLRLMEILEVRHLYRP